MKKIFNIIIIPILIIISYEMLSNSNEIINSVNFSFNIWKNNIFPSLFPFFIVSNLLINYGAIELFKYLFNPLTKLFKINSNLAIVIIMALLTGFPSSAIYTRKLYDEGIINEYEASKILMFTHFSNPLFLLGTLSINFLNDKKAGLLVLLTHYISNFIIGIIVRNYYPSSNNDKVNFKNTINNIYSKINNSKSFGNVLVDIINSSISALLTILGTITVFLVFTTIITSNINCSNLIKTILIGLLEMTSGLKYVSLLNISLKLKSSLSSLFISFGGFAIHMQVISSINDSKIKYYPFFISRIIHAIIASILTFILFDFI